MFLVWSKSLTNLPVPYFPAFIPYLNLEPSVFFHVTCILIPTSPIIFDLHCERVAFHVFSHMSSLRWLCFPILLSPSLLKLLHPKCSLSHLYFHFTCNLISTLPYHASQWAPFKFPGFLWCSTHAVFEPFTNLMPPLWKGCVNLLSIVPVLVCVLPMWTLHNLYFMNISVDFFSPPPFSWWDLNWWFSSLLNFVFNELILLHVFFLFCVLLYWLILP